MEEPTSMPLDGAALDAVPVADEPLGVELGREGRHLVIVLRGEADAYSAKGLADRVASSIVTGVEQIEIRSAELGFIDSSGITQVLAIVAAGNAVGARTLVIDAHQAVRRTFEMCGLEDLLA